jgi:hypothetical protein
MNRFSFFQFYLNLSAILIGDSPITIQLYKFITFRLLIVYCFIILDLSRKDI